MSQDYLELLEELKGKLQRAMLHLEFSQQKTAHLSTAVSTLSEEDLAHWESLTARFSRVAELFLQRYLRTWILIRDPGFSGSFRDYLNAAHKYGLIESIDPWMKIREMRNRMSHEYEEVRVNALFEDVRVLTPFLLGLKNKLAL